MYVDSNTVREAVEVREKEIADRDLSPEGGQYWYLQGQIDILNDLLEEEE